MLPFFRFERWVDDSLGRGDGMDADAFDEYFSAKCSVLVGHVTARWGNRDEASDAVQEAFVRAWTKRSEFGRHPHPDAWIRTVARNPLTDGWRRKRRHTTLEYEPVANPRCVGRRCRV